MNRKDLDKRDCIDNFRPITVEAFAKELVNRFARVANGLIRDAHTCGIPGRNFKTFSTFYA